MLLPFQGDFDTLLYTQGDCPGLIDAGPSGRSPSYQSVSFVFKIFLFGTPPFLDEREGDVHHVRERGLSFLSRSHLAGKDMVGNGAYHKRPFACSCSIHV